MGKWVYLERIDGELFLILERNLKIVSRTFKVLYINSDFFSNEIYVFPLKVVCSLTFSLESFEASQLRGKKPEERDFTRRTWARITEQEKRCIKMNIWLQKKGDKKAQSGVD